MISLPPRNASAMPAEAPSTAHGQFTLAPHYPHGRQVHEIDRSQNKDEHGDSGKAGNDHRIAPLARAGDEITLDARIEIGCVEPR